MWVDFHSDKIKSDMMSQPQVSSHKWLSTAKRCEVSSKQELDPLKIFTTPDTTCNFYTKS